MNGRMKKHLDKPQTLLSFKNFLTTDMTFVINLDVPALPACLMRF